MIREVLDVLIVLLAAAVLFVAADGDLDMRLGGLRLRVHEWLRPAVALTIALIARAWLDRSRTVTIIATRGLLALVIAAIGIYLQHHVRVAGGLDSYGYVSTANLIASGRLSERQPLAGTLPFAGALDAATPLGYVPRAADNTSVPRFPIGMPLVMAGFRALGPQAVYFVPLVMSIVALALMYVLAGGSAVGLFAAALLAVDPLFVAYAIQPMSDVPATCWMLAALCAATRTPAGRRQVALAALAGICGGMAILTRTVLLPAVIVLVAVTWDASRRKSHVVFAAIVAVFIVMQGILNVMLYGGVTLSGYGTTSHMFEMSVQRFLANAANYGKWLTYSQSPFVWILWPVAMVVLRRDRFAWQASAVAIAAAAPYAFYIVFDDWESSRFLLPAIAIVLVLAARALASLFQASRAVATAHVVFLAVALACGAASHRFLVREGTYGLATLEAKYALAGEWFKKNTSDRVVVLASLHSGPIRMYGERQTVRWDHIPAGGLSATLRHLIAAGYEPYLALDEPSEPPLFAERFGGIPRSAEPIARVRVVNIYRFVSAY